MRRLVASVVLVLWASTTMAQSEYSAPVLLVNPDARFVGLGNGGVAVADDISAMYLNPAGLGFQSEGEIMTNYSKLLPGLTDQFQYMSVAFKDQYQDYGTFGLAVYYMNQGESTIMYEDGTPGGTINSNEMALSFSGGRKSRKFASLAYGVNVKFIISNLASGSFDPSVVGDGRAFAMALDGGVLWHRPFDKVNIRDKFSLAPFDFGISLLNFGTRLNYSDSDHKDALPLQLRLGTVYNHQIDSEHQLRYMLDMSRIMTKVNKGESADMAIVGFFTSLGNAGFVKRLNWHLGTEYVYRGQFFGRIGFDLNPIGESNTMNLGFGLIYNQLRFDFADEIGSLNNSLRFTISYAL